MLYWIFTEYLTENYLKREKLIIKDGDSHISKYNPAMCARVLFPYPRATHENDPKMADRSRRPRVVLARVASPGCFERR